MAITDKKKDLLLGKDSETLINNADENFNSLFDTVDDLNEAITKSGYITKDVNNLTNYTVKTETGTDIELSLNTSDYKMTLNLKNANGDVVSTATIDFPIESVVVDASYANGKITLTLQNGTTTEVDVSALVSGLVPNTRTVNGKALSSNITLTQDNIGDGTDYKRFSSSDKAKLDKFSVDGNGNLTYDGNEIGKVKGITLNGEEVELDENGVANIDLSDISVDVEALESNYINVKPKTVTLNNKSYNAIEVKDTDVSLEVLNTLGQAVVTQVIRADGKIYYCFSSDDTNTYTLRKVGGNGVSGSSKLYRHRIYMSMTGGAYMVLVYYNRSSAQFNEIEATWNGIPVVGMHGSTLSPILHVDFNYENRNQKVKIYTVANQAGAEVYYENINVIDTVEEVV